MTAGSDEEETKESSRGEYDGLTFDIDEFKDNIKERLYKRGIPDIEEVGPWDEFPGDGLLRWTVWDGENQIRSGSLRIKDEMEVLTMEPRPSSVPLAIQRYQSLHKNEEELSSDEEVELSDSDEEKEQNYEGFDPKDTFQGWELTEQITPFLIPLRIEMLPLLARRNISLLHRQRRVALV